MVLVHGSIGINGWYLRAYAANLLNLSICEIDLITRVTVAHNYYFVSAQLFLYPTNPSYLFYKPFVYDYKKKKN